MTYRGQNPVAGTTQVWSGTKWVSLDTLTLSADGTSARIQSVGGVRINEALIVPPATGLAYQMPSARGQAGDVLLTDGAGVVSWVDPSILGGDSAEETYPVALVTGEKALYSGQGGGAGNLWCTLFIPKKETAPLSQMTAVVPVVGGGTGNIAFGLYDQLGNRLAYTDPIAVTTPGAYTAPFVFGAGVQLLGGLAYYMAIYSNINALRTLTFTGYNAFPAGFPPTSFMYPNSGAATGAVNGFPPNVASNFGNQQTDKLYSLVE